MLRAVEYNPSQADLNADKPLHERAMSEKVTTRVMTSVSEVEEIRGIWSGWRQHPNSDVDVYLNTLRSRPEYLRPHVIVVYRDDCAEALLVGRLELKKIELKLGYAGLPPKKMRALTFLYGGLLGALSPKGSEAMVREIMNSLSLGDADLAYFNHLKADSPLYRAARNMPGIFCRDHVPQCQTHRGMRLPGSVDEFYLGLSAKVRKNLKWQAKKLVREYSGNVSVRCFRETSDLDRMIQDVDGIARKTYQRGLGVGFTDSFEMHRRLSLEAEKGWLRGYVLYVQNAPSAFWIGTLYLGTFHSDYMGYDPALGKYSPGMFLAVKVIEELCNGSDSGGQIYKIDFGLGDAQYKEVLGDSEWSDASLYIFPCSFKGIGLNVVRTSAAILERVARRALEESGLLGKVKKMWRLRTTPTG